MRQNTFNNGEMMKCKMFLIRMYDSDKQCKIKPILKFYKHDFSIFGKTLPFELLNNRK